jgi:two-component system sensor histidine kinase PilS (NtrC family)
MGRTLSKPHRRSVVHSSVGRLQRSGLVVSSRSLQPSPKSPAAGSRPLSPRFDSRLLLRWIYVARLALATAIFIAGSISPAGTTTELRLRATQILLAAVVWTVCSFGYGPVLRRPIGTTFLYLQAVFDLVLVTAVVHVTSMDGDISVLVPLYLLVIASSSLLLPTGGSWLIATLGMFLYLGDVSLLLNLPLTPVLWVQLLLFAVVALASGFISAELRRRGDVSDLLRVEHARVAIRAEEILKNIRSGVITIDNERSLVYANPMADALLGFPLSSFVGQGAPTALAAAAPELRAALDAAVDTRVRTQRLEGTITSDGRSFPVGVTTTYVEDEATGTRSAIAIFNDISDNKRMEAMRIRAERLEGIAELSASLAHEIKNPLASIRSSVEQLSRRPRTTPDERTLSDLVLRESDRLSRLLSEFLDFARVRVTQSHPVDLRAVVRDAADLAAAHPDRPTGVQIICELPEVGEAIVDGDEDLLHRAVFNLALNAVQASSAGGEVHIDLAADAGGAPLAGLSTSVGAADEVVVLRVRDAGSGIPPEIRDRLFDPFFTTKPFGSGLGLAVVQRAVEAHRGHIMVDTGANGTCFTMVIPRTRAPARSAMAGVGAESGGNDG